MGKHRTPSKILELRGSFQHDPQRRRPAEPVPVGELGQAPRYLTPAQRRVWRELAEIVPPGVLGNSDRWIVEIAARLMAKMREAGELGPGQLAQLVGCLARLGMTPADRSRIGAKTKAPENPFSQNGRRQA